LTLDEPPEPADVSEELVVYGHLIAAVLSVLTFCLASREGFTPLNSRTLVSSSSLPITQEYKSLAERNGKEEILPSRPVADPDLVTPLVLELEAYMTSAGTLVVIPHSEKQRAIQRVGTGGLTPASLQNREVFIAPWGEWGRLVPPSEIETDNPLRKRAEEKWKESVISYLKDKGIISAIPTDDHKKCVLQEAIEQGEWLNVEIWLRPLTDLSMGDLHRILWPEALLFLRSSEGDKRAALPIKENPDFWKMVFDDPEYVQLAWGKLASLVTTLDIADDSKKTAELDAGAEWWNVPSAVQWSLQWYKGREERAKKIKEHVEEKQRRELAEIRNREERALMADKGKGKFGAEAKQGPVYPTPPDGAASILNGGPASTSSTGATDVSTAFNAGSTGMDLDWPSEPTANNNDHMIPRRETDLFGDTEMDLLMKVTEDDFDFFDNEPDFGEVEVGSGGMDLDVGGLSGGLMDIGSGNSDLRMGTPPPVQNSVFTAPSTQKPERNKKRSRMVAPPELKEIPPMPENQVRTPPLSPHRAIGLLVPGYQPPSTNGINFTPPASGGGFKKPSITLTRTQKPPPPRRRSSMYSPIMFTESVDIVDQKYALGGRFFLSEPPHLGDEQSGKDVTKINRPQNLKRKRRTGAPSSVLTASTTPAIGDTPDDYDDDTSSSEWESEESDVDDSTEDEAYHTSPGQKAPMQQLGFLGWGKKRKYPSESGAMDIDTPEGFPQRRDVAIGVDGEVDIIPELAPPPWQRMQPEPVDESLVGAFEDISLTSEALALTSLADTEFQEVATVLAGQVTGWAHASWSGKNETSGDDEEDEETNLIRRRSGRDQTLVEDAVKALFKEGAVVRCNLGTYAAIADSIQEPPPIPPPPPLGHLLGGRGPQALKPNLSQRRNKPTDDITGKNEDVFMVPPPHIRLQRGDNVLEMLAPALYFWETFSLAPISGGKNVISFCFYPGSSAMMEGADLLLERVSSSYEAGRFGVHVRGSIDGIVENGLIGVDIPPNEPKNYENGMKALYGAIESFGSVLAHGVADEGMNCVIYVVNPFSHPAALVDICTSFVRMQRVYEASIATLPEAKPNHLALQIVPASFVAHKLGGVMRVGVVHRLAVEVYTRCIPTDPGIDYAEAKRAASPPIQLARPIPEKIEFRLTTEPSPALLKENQLLHIAYSQSLDERWVSVAWSDNTGSVQKTAIINLGRRNCGVLRAFDEVLTEIWDTTVELIKYPAVRWRLAITKVCATTMPQDEIDKWKSLVKTHERVSATYLLSADLNCPVRIQELLLPEMKMDGFWPQTGFYSTPPVVNTPTPGATGPGSIVSPDASAATPGGPDALPELDPEAELLDARDESWGVVLAHTFPVRGEVETSRRSARPTGLLVRREDAWKVVVMVHVVEGGGKEVVREVLRTWRGLGVLGGFVGGRPGVPWMLSWCQRVEEVVARVM
jgi:mediator of RNA polymerase II transcription subunit 13